MKPALLILFLFATLAASASASKAISFLGDDPYSITRFDVSDTGHLDVQTSGGHILVVGTDERVARVEMHVRKNGRNLTKADTDLTGFDIVIEKQGQTLVAKAERSTRIGNLLDGLSSTSISFTVYVPRGVHLQCAHLRWTHRHPKHDLRPGSSDIRRIDVHGEYSRLG